MTPTSRLTRDDIARRAREIVDLATVERPRPGGPVVSYHPREGRTETSTMSLGITDVVRQAASVIERVQDGVGSPHGLTSRAASAWDGVYAEALSALDEIERLVRPALEEGRRRTAQLTVDLAEDERQRAAELDEQRRQEALDDAVRAEVAGEERRRLDAIETKVRKRLTTTGSN